MSSKDPDTGNSHQPRRDVESIVDWHLDQLDDEARLRFLQELDRRDDLRKKSVRLGQLLAPLDLWSAAAPPAHLVNRVLAQVSTPARIEEEVAAPTRRTRPFLSLREFAAMAACVVLLMGVLFPVMSEVRKRSQQSWCCGNLRSIANALAAYEQESGGSLPYAGSLTATAWLPEGANGVELLSNSRHFFRLLKGGYISNTEELICPSDPSGLALSGKNVWASMEDFVDAQQMSYDTLNLAGATPQVRPQANLAYMGDANPLFRGGRFHAKVDPTRSNSAAHGGRGQNVLAIDGSASFIESPKFGPKGDNIWMSGDLREYHGTETPNGADDSQLIPGIPGASRNGSL